MPQSAAQPVTTNGYRLRAQMEGDLLARTAELVDIASVSHAEGPLADVVERELVAHRHLEVTRIGDNVIARTLADRTQRVVLAGHLDTVPPAGNGSAVVEGVRVRGCGAADMKGGLAVMLELARALTDPAVDVTYVFYACEEVERRFSGLKAIESERPDLLAADAALVLEPTGALVEAGCQGVLRIGVTLRGRRAHSARPWAGVNAIHRLGPVLARIGQFVEREPILDGCRYRETLQAVNVAGGIAGNVVPDECALLVSHRFAPDRSADDAFRAVEALLAPALDESLGDRIELLESAPAAPPALSHPLLAAVVGASHRSPRAKIAWTDVALFAERGVAAANFGPGDPLVAHSPDEFVERHDLERVYDALTSVLTAADDGTV